MRKLFFLSALALGSMICSAGVRLPQCFSENFGEDEGFMLPDTWSYSGLDVVPDDPEGFFLKGEYWIPLASDKSTIWAVSNSTFVADAGGVRPQADEWLISPEFTITSDDVIVSYDVLAEGSDNDSEYSVYISDSANTPSLFKKTEPVYTGKLRNDVKTISFHFPGMKGKTVRMAFNNHSTDAAYLGFTNISVVPYIADVLNNTPTYVANVNEVEVTLNAWVKTERECPGITAKLVGSDGTESVYTSDLECKDGQRFTVVFPDKLKISTEKPQVTYTVTITPNLEDMESVIVEGNVLRSITYKRKVVLEEFTGTWCPNCTRGHASIEKYSTLYPDNFVAVGLHADDPMDCSYTTSLGLKIGVSDFPTAVFSRSKVTGPENEDALKELINEEASVRISVDRVDYNSADGKVDVNYSVRNGFTTNDAPYSVAAILVEDNVTPPANLTEDSAEYREWYQYNALTGISEVDCERAFGAGWWEYIEPYASAGAVITPIVHNHVGRAIYPSVNGRSIGQEWIAEEDVTGKISFTMPSNVKAENTYIIAVVIDDNSEVILNAEQVYFDKYNSDSSVGIVAVDEAKVARDGDSLIVSAEAGSVVRVFSADGLLLGTYNHDGGAMTIDGSSFGGMLIVRVDGNNASAVKKIMWK